MGGYLCRLCDGERALWLSSTQRTDCCRSLPYLWTSSSSTVRFQSVSIPDVTVLTINSEGQRLRKGYLDVDRTSNHERRQGNNHPQSLSQHVSDKPSVHLGHAGLIHPSHLPHQDRHHLHLHPSLPQQSLSDGMLGHDSTLRSFYVVDDHCCHPGLCSCGGCLDELEGNQGGGVLR